ncbi:MAG TPA: hemolysin family protein [Rhabdochlamydiaceae bacterium]|jgi:CBS domain containing-hemolysin-like protein|nr:hemolysin family protein [Rhabdochlamydiaceae bacterium]
MTVLIVVLAVLLFFSGLFSASETALFSLSSLKVKTYKHDKDPRKQLIAALLSNPRQLLVTIIMLNIAINILIQNVTSSMFGEASSWALNVGVPLALTLILGEVIPKSLALVYNDKIAYRMAPVIRFLQTLLMPIRRLLVAMTNHVSRILFFFLRKEKEISIDELQHALRTSRSYGVLNEDEAELVQGYLALQESTVKERMRPREEVLFFDLDEPLTKLMHLFVDQECSRIPVCDKGLDQIVGVVTSRLFFLHREEIDTIEDLKKILERPFFVPETVPAKILLRQFYDRQDSFAIVVDEYGSVSGIVALEDLVETVIGEIVDRRDETNLYTKSGEDVIIASGKMELADLEKIFDVAFTSANNMVTIGGYLTEKMGDIPKSGSKYTTDDFLFHVLAAEPTKVRRVYIRRLRQKR